MQERKIRYLISNFLKEVLLPQQPASSDSESQEPLNEEAILEIKDTEELITEDSALTVMAETPDQPEPIMEETINDQVKEEEASEIWEAEGLMEKEVEVVKEDSAEPGVIDEVISEGVSLSEKPVIFKKWSGLMERMAAVHDRRG